MLFHNPMECLKLSPSMNITTYSHGVRTLRRVDSGDKVIYVVKVGCRQGVEMRPIDFYMGVVNDWDLLPFESAKMKSLSELSAAMRMFLPKTAVAFDAPKELLGYGVSKHDGAKIKIGSLFGCYEFDAPVVVDGEMLSVVCVDQNGFGKESKIKIEKDWSLAWGRNPSLNLQVNKRGDGRFEPTCSSWVFRGASGFEEGVEVFLPSLPRKVSKITGGVELDCDGLLFVVEGDPESRLVLEGKVQWYVPNQKGVFEKST